MLYNILIFYFNFLSCIIHWISLHISNFISKLHSIVLKFSLEDLVTSEQLLSLLEQMLLGLLNGILSLFDNENNSGEDPEDPDGPEKDPEDPNRSLSGNNPDNDDPDKDNPDKDNPDSKKKSKGKERAITPESLPEEPTVPEEPSVSKEPSVSDEELEKRLDSDISKAIAKSLEQDDEDDNGKPESSEQGRQRELRERDVKQGVKSRYSAAVQEYNDNQSQLVDNPNIHPDLKQYLIERSQSLREKVDHYKALKETLDIESSEEEYSSEDYSSEYSDSENTRPSKRPKND